MKRHHPSTRHAGARTLALSLALATVAAGCATPAPAPSTQHLEPAPPVAGQAPEFSTVPALPPPPRPMEKAEVYSVVVHNLSVRDLLFALARDAKLSVSIHSGISGTVTMSALDQNIIEILDVIATQVDLRYELNGKKLSIMPDVPYLKMYKVNYPNISRRAESSIGLSTMIGGSGGGSGRGGGVSNQSNSRISNTANNDFWNTLIENLRDLLRETDRIVTEDQPAAAAPATAAAPAQPQPAVSSVQAANAVINASDTARASQAAPAAARPVTYREAASIIANPENGVIDVRATQRQHDKVREFLDSIMENARRQVLIEATIVEVDLSDRYQQGIDWSLIRNGSTSAQIDFSPVGPSNGMITGGLLSGLSTLTINKAYKRGSISAVTQLLESFGTLRVLSSPKLSMLNSQTSVLKVVDNEIYFTIDVTAGTAATLTTPAIAPTYTSQIHTVPIGFLMTVMPQIDGNGEVILNLRPTISRINSYAADPSPALKNAGVTNMIPVVQSREMESIMRVQSGDIAVLGGLIQDSSNRNVDGIPGLNKMPGLGDLFSYKDNRSRKTELVIFIRPTVLNDASLAGDFRDFRAVVSDTRKAFGNTSDRRLYDRP